MRTKKPKEKLLRWRVSMITKTPAKFIDFTLAPDAISDRQRDRLVPFERTGEDLAKLNWIAAR